MEVTRGRALFFAALFSGLVAAALMLCSPGQALAAQESEPNNSFAAADAFRIGDVVRGVISEKVPGSNDYEYDYFSVYIPEAGQYKLTGTNDTYEEYASGLFGCVQFNAYNQYFEPLTQYIGGTLQCNGDTTRPQSTTLNLAKGTNYIKISTYLDLYHQYHFKVTPVINKTSITKVTAGKKSATVKFRKMLGSTKYEIRYAKNKKMSGAKKVTVKASKSSAKIKKLQKNKKYYFQVRVVKKMEGKNFYSNWSTKKSVKITR